MEKKGPACYFPSVTGNIPLESTSLNYFRPDLLLNLYRSELQLQKVNVIRANREVDPGNCELFDPDLFKLRHDWHYAVATLW